MKQIFLKFTNRERICSHDIVQIKTKITVNIRIIALATFNGWKAEDFKEPFGPVEFPEFPPLPLLPPLPPLPPEELTNKVL